MAISFPLTPPTTPGFITRDFTPRTTVGMSISPFTFAQQVYAWPGQMLAFSLELPPMSDAEAGEWSAFFLALNGREGTFYFGDPVRRTSRGTVSGSWVVNGTQTAGSTTLALKSGSGLAALGDWLQVNTSTNSRLHRVIKVNTTAGAMTSVDVFPRLRAAHTDGTAVSFTNPVGVFRLSDLPSENFHTDSLAHGVAFSAVESL